MIPADGHTSCGTIYFAHQKLSMCSLLTGAISDSLDLEAVT